MAVAIFDPSIGWQGMIIGLAHRTLHQTRCFSQVFWFHSFSMFFKSLHVSVVPLGELRYDHHFSGPEDPNRKGLEGREIA